MRYLKAWLLGSVAAAVLSGAVVAVLSSAAAAGAVPGLRVALFGIVLVRVETVAKATETTIGPALPLLALLGGLLNVGILALLARRGRRGTPVA